MTTPARIKTRQCCGFTTPWLRKRVCPTCGVPAIWVTRTETEAEVAARAAHNARLEATMARLLADDGPQVEVSLGQIRARQNH